LKKTNPEIVIVDKTASYQAIVFSVLKSFFKYKLVSIDAHLPSGFKAEGNQLAKEIFYKVFRLLFSNLINKKVDKFIAVQEKTKDIMRKYYGITKKICDIPLGTDLNLFKFSQKYRDITRRNYNLEDDDFVAIYTGKVIKEKGVDILMSALNKLAKKNKKLKLMIVGTADLDYERYCLSKLDNQYHPRVVWVGFQPAKELYKFYSASDVGVWPLQESMSMNDAAACGIPFIANNTIGARIRLSNDNALLYKKNNSDDLASKIEFLLKHKKVAQEMGRNGRELMEKRFSWDNIANEYITFEND
jgi:glycosyltransferase involved in cell wall biosynthesis